ncbi:MAG: divalent-cation tolerance protein CutA [Chthoniobacterales bacterium]
MKTSLCLLITSFPHQETAFSVIRSLVKEQLVACGTLLPQAHSIYMWQGKLEETPEVMVVLKTSDSLLERCMKRLKKLHPYDVPEIVAIEPIAVGEAYGAWVQEVLNPDISY